MTTFGGGTTPVDSFSQSAPYTVPAGRYAIVSIQGTNSGASIVQVNGVGTQLADTLGGQSYILSSGDTLSVSGGGAIELGVLEYLNP